VANVCSDKLEKWFGADDVVNFTAAVQLVLETGDHFGDWTLGVNVVVELVEGLDLDHLQRDLTLELGLQLQMHVLDVTLPARYLLLVRVGFNHNQILQLAAVVCRYNFGINHSELELSCFIVQNFVEYVWFWWFKQRGLFFVFTLLNIFFAFFAFFIIFDFFAFFVFLLYDFFFEILESILIALLEVGLE